MKILITGAGGMLGTDLREALSPEFDLCGILHREPAALDIPTRIADLTQVRAATEAILELKPTLIFHAAAMTDVDGCERDRESALRNNFEATKHVVNAANRAGAVLFFFTTDYVFDGRKKGEYTEEDIPHPLNVYGESKYLAETYIREKAARFSIFRVSWLYGRQGKSFPRTILEKTESVKILEVVDDQIGRPTCTRDLAQALRDLLRRKKGALEPFFGETFNLANSGTTSWYDFARFLLEAAGRTDVQVKPRPTSAGMRPALRPLNSVLALGKAEKALGIKLRDWREPAAEFVQEFLARKTAGTNP